MTLVTMTFLIDIENFYYGFEPIMPNPDFESLHNRLRTFMADKPTKNAGVSPEVETLRTEVA